MADFNISQKYIRIRLDYYDIETTARIIGSATAGSGAAEGRQT
jgi:hypothetical protein